MKSKTTAFASLGDGSEHPSQEFAFERGEEALAAREAVEPSDLREQGGICAFSRRGRCNSARWSVVTPSLRRPSSLLFG